MTLLQSKIRYSKDGPVNARPPVEGYILQETSTSIGSTVEIQNTLEGKPCK